MARFICLLYVHMCMHVHANNYVHFCMHMFYMCMCLYLWFCVCHRFAELTGSFFAEQ